MTTDSVTQIVKYQRSIGALPHGTGFSVGQHWARPLGSLGGSVQKYVAGYKGVTTYTKLMGLPGVIHAAGVVVGLLNGANAKDAGQSPSWNAIIAGLQAAYNAANNKGATFVLQSFNISSPASNVPDLASAIELGEQLVLEALQTHSVTASGTFQLDIQNAQSFNPFGLLDPEPVFDWSITISVDDSTRSMTLTLDIRFDHMESKSILEDFLGLFGALTTVVLLGIPPDLVTAAGLGVGQAATGAFNAHCSGVLVAMMAQFSLPKAAGPIPGVNWPIEFNVSHSQATKFRLSVTYQFDPTTWNELATLFNQAAPQVAARAALFGISFP